jgi:hypothetical protein
MGLYVVGGLTQYYVSSQDGDPDVLNQPIGDNTDIGDPLVGDPNALQNFDLYSQWGEDAYLYWPAGQPEATSGRYATLNDNQGAWCQLIAAGKTDINYNDDQPIWYRTFLVVTDDPQRPNAVQIVGGKELFWWDNTNVVSGNSWGQATSSWIGVGISSVNVEAATQIGNLFLYPPPELGGGLVGFPDFGAPGGNDENKALDDLTNDAPIPPNPYQLIAVAKHDPWGWGLSQIRLYTQPAVGGAASPGLIGWKLAVRDMNDQDAWFTTNQWGDTSAQLVQPMGVGQWWTRHYGWGPSFLNLYFAPAVTVQIQPARTADPCQYFAVAGSETTFVAVVNGANGDVMMTYAWTVDPPDALIGDSGAATCVVKMPDPPAEVTVNLTATVTDTFSTSPVAVTPYSITPWTSDEATRTTQFCHWFRQHYNETHYIRRILIGPGDAKAAMVPLSREQLNLLRASMERIVTETSHTLRMTGEQFGRD